MNAINSAIAITIPVPQLILKFFLAAVVTLWLLFFIFHHIHILKL
jgi:hypothetical protein